MPTAQAFHYVEEDTVTDCTPPNPYEEALKRLRAASVTPESSFADRYREARLAEFAAEWASPASAAPRPRLTSLAEFEPPDPYRLALEKMRSENR
jgi:hypothetical protein